MQHRLTRELAASFADIALAHVTREYPAKLDHVLAGPSDLQTPGALHPAFHGSFDWHSCVHGFWLLAKILRLYPDLEQAPQIGALFDRQLSAANIAGELHYLQRPEQRSFERPYGWAWLLMLASELRRHDAVAVNTREHASTWQKNVRPLAAELAKRFGDYLTKLPYPVRAGTHPNTAFAAALAIEYAQVCGEGELLDRIRKPVTGFFGADADCRAYEPGGSDFHSPILVEMECMRRALAPADFLPWLDCFLPRLAAREPRVLFEPVMVPDRADPHIVHLDGLNFSRAWCWRMLATALPQGDPRRHIALDASTSHIAQSLAHLADDYVGEHWLATFAMLALEARSG